mmetsp:Transcript_14056/g.21470  ORF Transcript_14056/g.21470 Transcript_14056/m.21470 type:complete len:221 (-) Transcript_14056:358-1020(-)|eukprot:CAMPEP_0178900796 /NCGR_PEP_ID=MMETSP0786-20121207/3667_1 /TAXON_ID=186022 /ORGANISM="Thalassionema frauenfeldii, Strain CCMP 1798" /LENGTH=220 /DNA_ID=CAMNT_0020571829 /DNA_START=56 /DNA_END=721 /DNA_ORIENTATION=+
MNYHYPSSSTMMTSPPGRRSGRTTPTSQRSARRRGRNKQQQQQQKERLEKVREWVSIERQHGNCGMGVMLWVPLEQLTPTERTEYDAKLLEEKTKKLQEEASAQTDNDNHVEEEMKPENQVEKVEGVSQNSEDSAEGETESGTKTPDRIGSRKQSLDLETSDVADQFVKKSDRNVTTDLATEVIPYLGEQSAEDNASTVKPREDKNEEEIGPEPKKARLE